MSKIIDMDEYRGGTENWYMGFALCVSCFHRWMASVTVNVNLTRLECPQCHKQTSFFSFLSPEYAKEFIERVHVPDES